METSLFKTRIQAILCIGWIQSYFSKPENEDCVAVLGISGGKDSTVAAALCAEALGKDRVIGVLMPNGIQGDFEDSLKVIKTLGIKSVCVNIQKPYESIIEEISDNVIKCSEQTKINLAPRLRMSTLFAVAQSVKGRVVCTSNKSEYKIGYYTMFGDDCGYFAPLRHWLCREVIEVGKSLGLPNELLDKAPSDGLSGKSDEDVFGFTYNELDA